MPPSKGPMARVETPASERTLMATRGGAAVLRRGRAASALLAMVVAAAVTTAMLNLYVDVQAKLRREFRNYGANILLVGRDGASLPADALPHVESILAGRGVVAPFAPMPADSLAHTRAGRRTARSIGRRTPIPVMTRWSRATART